jgi:hypothetical protein
MFEIKTKQKSRHLIFCEKMMYQVVLKGENTAQTEIIE